MTLQDQAHHLKWCFRAVHSLTEQQQHTAPFDRGPFCVHTDHQGTSLRDSLLQGDCRPASSAMHQPEGEKSNVRTLTTVFAALYSIDSVFNNESETPQETSADSLQRVCQIIIWSFYPFRTYSSQWNWIQRVRLQNDYCCIRSFDLYRWLFFSYSVTTGPFSSRLELLTLWVFKSHTHNNTLCLSDVCVGWTLQREMLFLFFFKPRQGWSRGIII